MSPVEHSASANWRLFLAVKLSAAALDSLSAVSAALRRVVGGNARGVSWVNPDNLHLTLKFLGEVSTGMIPQIEAQVKAATGDLPAFSLDLRKAGCFPSPANPRVIWVGLGGDPGLPVLLTLQQILEQSLVPLGFAPEERSFQPHVTLGRVKQLGALEKRALGDAIKKVVIPATPPISITNLYLMRSELKAAGAVYTVVVPFPLSGPRRLP